MLNTITVMGRLTRNPELRQTSSGISVVRFSIACDRDFGANGERQTDFINCIAWRTTADFISKYFQKGSLCVVNGSLQINRWKDKEDNNRETPEIVVSNIYFAESKKTDVPSIQVSAPSAGSPWGGEDEGNLPF